MAKSTKDYLLEKKDLEEAIGWYAKTIRDVEEQNRKRKITLEHLMHRLSQIEEEYRIG
jgi:prefoldin subunit 5